MFLALFWTPIMASYPSNGNEMLLASGFSPTTREKSYIFVFFPWDVPQLLQSDWSLSCDHGLDYYAS